MHKGVALNKPHRMKRFNLKTLKFIQLDLNQHAAKLKNPFQASFKIYLSMMRVWKKLLSRFVFGLIKSFRIDSQSKISMHKGLALNESHRKKQTFFI